MIGDWNAQAANAVFAATSVSDPTEIVIWFPLVGTAPDCQCLPSSSV
jgi:hypothetical protein